MSGLDLDFDEGLKSVNLDDSRSSPSSFRISRTTDNDHVRNVSNATHGAFNQPSLSVYDSQTGGDDDDFISLLANSKKIRHESPTSQAPKSILRPSETPRSRPSVVSTNELLSESVFDTEVDLGQEADKLNSINLDDMSFPSSGGMSGPSFPNMSSSPMPNTYSFGADHSENSHNMTFEEEQREKVNLVHKFDALRNKGHRVVKVYNTNSDYTEMKFEYDRLIHQIKMDKSVKQQRHMLIGLVTGIEFLNNKFDPFDVRLDGWSGAVNDDINDYDDIFEELYDKYSDLVNAPPELRLMFGLASSAFVFHLNNTILKSSNVPGMEDIMRQNPDLARQFAQAATSSMSAESPGFSKFMGNLMGMKNGMNDQTTRSGVPSYDPLSAPPFANPRDAPSRHIQSDLPPPTDFDALLDGIANGGNSKTIRIN